MAIKKYLDEHGTEKVLKKIKNQIWRGTQAEWDALSAAEKDKYEQAEIIGLDNNGVVYVADKVESGNMNPVTSNAVANFAGKLYVYTLPVEQKFPARPAGTQPVTIASITVPKGTYLIGVSGRLGDLACPNCVNFWPLLDGVQYTAGSLEGFATTTKNMRYFNPSTVILRQYSEEHVIEFKEYFEGDCPADHYYNAYIWAVKIGG